MYPNYQQKIHEKVDCFWALNEVATLAQNKYKKRLGNIIKP